MTSLQLKVIRVINQTQAVSLRKNQSHIGKCFGLALTWTASSLKSSNRSQAQIFMATWLLCSVFYVTICLQDSIHFQRLGHIKNRPFSKQKWWLFYSTRFQWLLWRDTSQELKIESKSNAISVCLMQFSRLLIKSNYLCLLVIMNWL